MAPVVSDMTLQIPKGSSCLLIGPNGAGKTTFLKILGGKHMVPEKAVTVLGQPPFHATSLTADGKLAYLGGNWDRDIAFAGYSVPLQVCEEAFNGDLTAGMAASRFCCQSYTTCYLSTSPCIAGANLIHLLVLCHPGRFSCVKNAKWPAWH